MSKSSRNYSRNGSNNNKYRSHGKKQTPRHANPQQTLQKAKQDKEKYLNLARDSLVSSDRVEAESHFQYADHYTRVINMINQERNAAEQATRKNPASQVQESNDVSESSNNAPSAESNLDNVAEEYPKDIVPDTQDLVPADV